MATLEQLLKQVPDKVQFIIKAPHFVVNQGTIYWQKNLMDKKIVEPVINLIEGGLDRLKASKTKLETEVREVTAKNSQLEIDLRKARDEVEYLTKRLEGMKSAHESFSTEAEILLED